MIDLVMSIVLFFIGCYIFLRGASDDNKIKKNMIEYDKSNGKADL